MIWQRPYMVVGKDTYINSLLNYIGWENPFAQTNDRYPIITMEDLERAQLDYLFLATEPFPFKEENVLMMKEKLPKVQTKIIDGEMFWYGTQMTVLHEYFQDFYKELTLK